MAKLPKIEEAKNAVSRALVHAGRARGTFNESNKQWDSEDRAQIAATLSIAESLAAIAAIQLHQLEQ